MIISRRISILVIFTFTLLCTSCFNPAYVGVKASAPTNDGYMYHADNQKVNDPPTILNSALYKQLYEEYTSLRTREIKRRLALDHGYEQKEIAMMIHKSELVHALCREAYKEQKRKQSDLNRKRFWHIGGTIIIASVIYFLSPVWMQGYDIVSVNFVVYTDRKRHEASRCLEIGSFLGFIGFIFLFILEMLSFWLSISVLLSWFITRNKYFFPVPSIPVRPGALLNSATGGNPSNRQGLAGYSVNCGPMAISWILGFLNRKVQEWMGRCLAKAQREQKKATKKAAKKSQRTPEERAARKLEKAAKKAAKQDAVFSDGFPPKNKETSTHTNVNEDSAPSRDNGAPLDSKNQQHCHESYGHVNTTENYAFDDLD